MSLNHAAPGFAEVEFDPFAGNDIARVVPTTEAQREIWLASELSREGSLAYNESISLRLVGELDVGALQRALQALSDRHESLRATISADGVSLIILACGSLQAEVVDLSAKSDDARADVLAAARRDEVSTPFDLVEGPLARARLLKLGADRHELILTAHHIICDGWSFGVLARDLMDLYEALRVPQRGTPPEPGRLGDYVLGQQDPSYQALAEADTQWWVRQYDGNVPVLELPTDRPRQTFRSFNSLREDIGIDAPLVEALRKFGQKSGASMFVSLFGVFAATIARVSGQDDIVVGVPAAGQASEGGAALAGHCVQLLPIRVRVDMEQPASELLARTRKAVLDAYEHQACTFGQLLKKLQIKRDPGRLPLVSVLFNLDQAIPSKELSKAGLQVELTSNPRLFENFDLFVNASQIDGRIVIECQYNTDLYDAASVHRWLGLYRTALERLAGNGTLAVVEALAPTEADVKLLERFNASALDYPRDVNVHELIERQVARTPDAIAVVAGSQRISFRELDHRGNALAHALQELGVKKGDLVGLSCGRNEHMVAGLLGILKAGAGYVPMDPAFPAERLEYMLANSAARIIVSDGSVEADQVGGARRLLVDELGAREDAVAAAPGSDHVAYVIYTSGSTGQPKGVSVPHRTVANLIASVAREPGMAASDIVLSVTTLSFDIAVSEVIIPLTVGATIVVADRSQATDGDRLRELIETSGVNFIDATPSSWRLLVAAGWTGGRHIKAICTGEPLPPDLGRQLLTRVGELWNGYGPTETTVWSSFHRVLECEGPVPIGHPVANTQLHVVDSKLRLVPVGVTGEIFIGGEGVTLGYHGSRDLTEERFLPDPHRPGHTWYKTGDLGRWRPDGVLECFGRIDHQVKVRGYRIELGEIEAHLSRHPDVDRCVVVTREDEPGDVRLVAYAVSKGPPIDSNSVREVLRKTLPGYMIPSVVMELPKIPLLPNGKIDRSKLPRPQLLSQGNADAEPARTPLEAAVLRAFEEVLKLPELGVTDDFFNLGGHSLLAARLVALLNKDLGSALALRTIFEHPTARGIASVLEQASGAEPSGRMPITHQADQSTGPLTLMQERIRFMEALHPERVVYNTPSAHRLKGTFDQTAFAEAFARLVHRQPCLRTVIEAGPEGPRQRVLEAIPMHLPFEDLSHVDASSRETVLLERMQAIIDEPIDIGYAPLFRAALYRLAADEHVFLFMPHHIIWDGWSFDLLYEEMAKLYPAVLEGREAKLPPLPVSYVDYACWHRDWIDGKECASQIDYWRRRYSSLTPPSSLPTDRSRRAGMTGEGRVEWVRVDKDLTERLRQVAVNHGATLNMLVLAVFAAQMTEATASRSLVVGVPLRGRLNADVEPLMGFFNNLLPLPFEIDRDLVLKDWLAVVKGELVEAFAHQEVPFERLAAEPEIARHGGRSGLYQTLFSFQDARERQRRWGPLQHSSVLVMQKGATEDFGLWLMEVPAGLEGGINFNADLFDAATARIFKERLVGLLRRVASDPSQSLRSLLDAPGADLEAVAAWIEQRSRNAPAAADEENLEDPSSGRSSTALPAAAEGLSQIWARLLGLKPGDIDPDDNFFDLGGNSLLAMRAVVDARTSLGLEIDPRRYVYESLRQLCVTQGDGNNDAGSTEAMAGIAGIWSRLLGLDEDSIQPQDNFFDLGGTSLLAMQAVAAIERELGLKIDPRRMVYEDVRQLSVADAAAPAPAREDDKRVSQQSGGFMSRVLGRLGRTK